MAQDDYWYEIHLSNKQLVFYFMAAATGLILSFLAGVMVGRGAYGKPWFLKQVIHFLKTGERLPDPSLAQQREILLGHYDDMMSHYGVSAGVRVARKHLGWYARGFPGAAEFRNRVMKLTDPAAVHEAVRDAWDAALDAAPARAAA